MTNPTQLIEQLVAALETCRIMAADDQGNYTKEVTPKIIQAALTAARAHLKQPTEDITAGQQALEKAQGEPLTAMREANVQWIDAYAKLRLERDSLKKDAELGDIAMRFVDRAGDTAGCDPAERICSEFHKAMSEAVDRLYIQPRATHPNPPSQHPARRWRP